MAKLNQKGFSAIEIIIVVVVLAVLGGVAALVWSRKSTAKPAVSTGTKTTTNVKAKTTVDYTEPGTGFSFKVPVNWEKVEGHGLVVRFKAPQTDKDGAANYQANIQVHSDNYTGTLDAFTTQSVSDSQIPSASVSSIVNSQENTSTTNGVALSSFEETYTLTYDNTKVHCLNVLHVAKGKALYISACSLASKWADYKDVFMNGLLGFTY